MSTQYIVDDNTSQDGRVDTCTRCRAQRLRGLLSSIGTSVFIMGMSQRIYVVSMQMYFTYMALLILQILTR